MSPNGDFTTMEQVSAKLNSIDQTLKARDELDKERRKVDDERNKAAEHAREHLLTRVDGHGDRLRKVETTWEIFMGPIGAFTSVRRKIDKMDLRSNWIICLLVATLVGVVVNLATRR